jgi:monofunctional biosynthetic peptidoglycan transglycosylase
VARRGRLKRWLVRIAVAALVALLLPVLPVLWHARFDPGTTMFMRLAARELAAAGRPAEVVHAWAPLERIDADLRLAVIAAEDQKFLEHHGFDVEAIEKALAHNEKVAAGRARKVRGASTISQQVAKNLYLWSGRSWLRKGLEAYLTVLIEATWSKRRILEVYLNVAQFDADLFGAEAAAQRFFRKPAARLTRAEAALLAAVLPNPKRYAVEAPSRYVQRRQQRILRQMQALGLEHLGPLAR